MGNMLYNIKLLHSSLGRLEQLRLHVNLAEFRDTSTQLQERLHSIQDTHVGESNLLDKLQLGMLRERGNSLCHPEHGADDIMRGISQRPRTKISQASIPKYQPRVYLTKVHSKSPTPHPPFPPNKP